MRRILNKQFTNAEILDKATWIFENGIQNLKLYYMVGPALEEHADVEGIVDLTARIRERMLPGGAAGAAGMGRIHPSVNPFVPKPGTPTSGCPSRTRRRRTASSSSCARPSAGCPTWTPSARARARAPTQSVLALGDRRVADALEAAVVQGVDLKRGMKAAGLDPRFYLFRGRGRDEVLPWDIVDNGVSKAYYLRELDKSLKELPPPTVPSSRAASSAASAWTPRTRSTACPRSGRRWDFAVVPEGRDRILIPGGPPCPDSSPRSRCCWLRSAPGAAAPRPVSATPRPRRRSRTP
jgi:hypothetical protein